MAWIFIFYHFCISITALISVNFLLFYSIVSYRSYSANKYIILCVKWLYREIN